MRPLIFIASCLMFGVGLLGLALPDQGKTVDLKDFPQVSQFPQTRLVEPEWIKATADRKFRIAPLEVELCDEPPHLQDVWLPNTEAAFKVPIKKLALVKLEDRYCWGVLLVSTDKTWTKVKFGSYVPTLNVNAKKARN